MPTKAPGLFAYHEITQEIYSSIVTAAETQQKEDLPQEHELLQRPNVDGLKMVGRFKAPEEFGKTYLPRVNMILKLAY